MDAQSEVLSPLVSRVEAADLKRLVPITNKELVDAYGQRNVTLGLDCVCYQDGTFLFDEREVDNVPKWSRVANRLAEITKRTEWPKVVCASSTLVRREASAAVTLASGEEKENLLKDAATEQTPIVQELMSIIRDYYERDAQDIHIRLTGNDALFYCRRHGVMDLNPMHRPRSVVTRMISAAISDAGVENSEGDFDLNTNGSTKLDNILVQKNGKNAYISVRIQYRSLTSKRSGDKAIAIRILNTGKALKLHELGLPEKTQDVLSSVMRESSGMVLITGPTGAGKSTVSMAMLEAKPAEKVAHTIEDPIETLSFDPLVFQGNRKGDDYGDEVRDLMRMDPDIGQAGEIRDGRSLSEACGFARTGHLVMASMHATSIVGALVRMNDMGMSFQQLSEPNLFKVLTCQRLVPTPCVCAKKVKSYEEAFGASTNTEYKKLWIKWQSVASDVTLEKLKSIAREGNLRLTNRNGCKKCENTGISGRKLVMEYMVVDHFMRECVRNQEWDKLLRSLRQRGWKSLQDQGWDLISNGSLDPEVANEFLSGIIIDAEELRTY
ncbi:Flp pilus assembly complex ATPase component TadA [Vibrio vulnificus]